MPWSASRSWTRSTTMSWSPAADRMLTPSRGTSRSTGQVVDVCAMHKDTSAGSSDTEVKELAAMPTGMLSTTAATTATPDGKAPNTCRSHLGSNRVVVIRVWSPRTRLHLDDGLQRRLVAQRFEEHDDLGGH